MRNLELEILQMASRLVEDHLPNIGPPLAIQEPEILVRDSLSDSYTSELSIRIYRNLGFDDLIEILVYANGKPMISVEDAKEWIDEELGRLHNWPEETDK